VPYPSGEFFAKTWVPNHDGVRTWLTDKAALILLIAKEFEMNGIFQGGVDAVLTWVYSSFNVIGLLEQDNFKFYKALNLLAVAKL
jgi:protein associated with RNAse G/E